MAAPNRNKALAQIDDLEARLNGRQSNTNTGRSNDDPVLRTLTRHESTHPTANMIPAFERLRVAPTPHAHSPQSGISPLLPIQKGINQQWHRFLAEAGGLNHPEINEIWSRYIDEHGFLTTGLAAFRNALATTPFYNTLQDAIAMAGLIYGMLTSLEADDPCWKDVKMEQVIRFLFHTLNHRDRWYFRIMAGVLWNKASAPIIDITPKGPWSPLGMLPLPADPAQSPSPWEGLTTFVCNLFDYTYRRFNFQWAGFLGPVVNGGSSSACIPTPSPYETEEVRFQQPERVDDEGSQVTNDLPDNLFSHMGGFAEQDAECDRAEQSITTPFTQMIQISEECNIKRGPGRPSLNVGQHQCPHCCYRSERAGNVKRHVEKVHPGL